MSRRFQIAALSTALLAGVGVPMLPASAASGSGSISGVAFEDANRNGVQDAGEAPRSGDSVFVTNATGHAVGQTTTDESGAYTVTGLAAGTYTVQYSPATWWTIDQDWVPTTTGTIYPRQQVSVGGQARADFGWRRIVRSTSSPITAFTGDNGLRVESYNDVVTARELYDTLMTGTVGAEAPFVTVQFDRGPIAATTSSVAGSPGSYSNYQSTSSNTWATWLDGPWGVSHEYGHAWSNYYDTIVQQEGGFGTYLRLRGLAGDPRLGTSHAWEPGELIAEDYRQLLGIPAARAVAQENREIPLAKDVPGLLEYLRDTFTTPPAAGSAPGSSEPPADSEPAAPAWTVTEPVVGPTPVKQSATVTSFVSTVATVSLTVQTASGQPVATLQPPTLVSAGSVSASWDRRDESGRRVPAGTYRAVVTATVDGTTRSATTTFSVK
jgi:hypothetical protein